MGQFFLVMILLIYFGKLLVGDATATESVVRCTGELSTLTHSDCQMLEDRRAGCFYVAHFSQYKPCNSICDGVTVGLLEEEKCRLSCPDFYETNCNRIPLTTPATVTSKFIPTTEVVATKPHEETNEKASTQKLISILVPLLSIGVLAGIGAVLYRRYDIGSKIRECVRTRRQFDQEALQAKAVALDTEKLPTQASGTNDDEEPPNERHPDNTAIPIVP